MENYFHDLLIPPTKFGRGTFTGTKGNKGGPISRDYVNSEKMSGVANDEMYLKDGEIEDKNDDMGIKTDWDKKFSPAKGVLSQYDEIKNLLREILLTREADLSYHDHIKSVAEIIGSMGGGSSSPANTVASGSIMGAPGQMTPVGAWRWGNEGKRKKKKKTKHRSPLTV